MTNKLKKKLFSALKFVRFSFKNYEVQNRYNELKIQINSYLNKLMAFLFILVMIILTFRSLTFTFFCYLLFITIFLCILFIILLFSKEKYQSGLYNLFALS